MRIDLHIGPDAATTERVQRVFDAARPVLEAHSVLMPKALGARNHTRLFLAVSDPENVDALRMARGHDAPDQQAALRRDIARKLASEVRKAAPDRVILSAHQLGCALRHPSELTRLRDMLAPICDDIRIWIHVDDPARLLLRAYEAQVLEGRIRPLSLELDLLKQTDFRAAALKTWPVAQPERGLFAEAQGAAFWIDLAGLRQSWAAVFGASNVQCFSLDPDRLYGAQAGSLIAQACGLGIDMPHSEIEGPRHAPAAAWLSRSRRMNDVLLRYMAHVGGALPRTLWRRLLAEIRVDGPADNSGALHDVTQRFSNDISAICGDFESVDATHLRPEAVQDRWREADPKHGFRATQYMMAFRWRVDQALKEARTEAALRAATLSDASGQAPVDAILSEGARSTMPQTAKRTFIRLRRSAYAPHNRMGLVDETALAAPYTAAPDRDSSARVIVGCMKNEAPYVLEWIAYHRAIGFDRFVIYTNDCDDGTDAILDRLQTLGIVEHRDNGDWSGKSPQQFALDQARREPLIRQAEWIAHIDVDEFVNIRCGNGTLDDLFARVPDATNIAMTWRLFGHNGVARLEDQPVIEQFDHAAPKYCPKPHTAWGFKTLFRNIGAYGKFSCHRPNKLDTSQAHKVRWVNGSGQDMTDEALKNGWRNSRKSIGYDLVQLNHYALRSAESFLIKRQRGRALHVDRSIGLNYWIRMDWSNVPDVTIQRNLPRLRDGLGQLLADAPLKRLHQAGLVWHRDKARSLHQNDEFKDLYDKAISLRLTETERVAWALALDMES